MKHFYHHRTHKNPGLNLKNRSSKYRESLTFFVIWLWPSGCKGPRNYIHKPVLRSHNGILSGCFIWTLPPTVYKNPYIHKVKQPTTWNECFRIKKKLVDGLKIWLRFSYAYIPWKDEVQGIMYRNWILVSIILIEQLVHGPGQFLVPEIVWFGMSNTLC